MSMSIKTEQRTGVETRYHGPTNFRGARISARYADHNPDRDPVFWVSWDYSLNSLDNHIAAAQNFVAKRPCDYPLDSIAIGTKSGYIFPIDHHGGL